MMIHEKIETDRDSVFWSFFANEPGLERSRRLSALEARTSARSTRARGCCSSSADTDSACSSALITGLACIGCGILSLLVFRFEQHNHLLVGCRKDCSEKEVDLDSRYTVNRGAMTDRKKGPLGYTPRIDTSRAQQGGCGCRLLTRESPGSRPARYVTSLSCIWLECVVSLLYQSSRVGKTRPRCDELVVNQWQGHHLWCTISVNVRTSTEVRDIAIMVWLLAISRTSECSSTYDSSLSCCCQANPLQTPACLCRLARSRYYRASRAW